MQKPEPKDRHPAGVIFLIGVLRSGVHRGLFTEKFRPLVVAELQVLCFP